MSRPATALRLAPEALPKQARSLATHRRLLDAAEALIEEKGPGEASIPEIVRRARPSVGGFYARFKDKDALLRALEERFFAEMAERVEALADEGRWAQAPIRTIVEACAAELVGVCGERRNLIAAFLTRAALDARIRADALRFRVLTSERITRLLLTRRDELAHPHPDRAIDLAVQFAFGLTLQRIVAGEIRAAGHALSEAELADEIARNFLAYIGAPIDR
jgi:AcrR family transcriptional regulator